MSQAHTLNFIRQITQWNFWVVSEMTFTASYHENSLDSSWIIYVSFALIMLIFNREKHLCRFDKTYPSVQSIYTATPSGKPEEARVRGEGGENVRETRFRGRNVRHNSWPSIRCTKREEREEKNKNSLYFSTRRSFYSSNP